MGVDDEYKMVSSQEEANEHLLETAAPISRSAYNKRNMFASIAFGALIGAAAMFVFSFLFSTPTTYTPPRVSETPAAEVQVSTATVTATSTVAGPTVTKTVINQPQPDYPIQSGVAPLHLVETGKIMDCGHTVEEARARDCIFDVMMQDWMPRACHDEALSERYLAAGNWTWWADIDATREISLEDMRKGEHPVIYVIQDYHKQHCIYAWEKSVRAMRNDWPLIEELISYDHVTHCRHSTLSKEAEAVRGVMAPTAWTRCALYRDWQGHFPSSSHSSVEKRSEPRFSEWI